MEREGAGSEWAVEEDGHPECKRKGKWGGRQRVPGEIKRSTDIRGGRWSWTLNFAQKRS